MIPQTTTLSTVTVTEEPAAASAPVVGRSDQLRRAVLLGVVIVIALVTGAVVGRVSAQSSPKDAGVDAGFARDMSAHHSQAVEMAMLVADRTTEPEIRVFGHDIALTQQEQIGRLKGWLVSWGLSPTGSQPAMAWMAGSAHGAHDKAQMTLLSDGRMPGMATTGDLDRLRALTARPAEVLFLQLMVAHHRGGIVMAEHAAKEAGEAVVRDLAAAIAAGQSAEIDVLQKKLKDRGAAPA